MSPWQQAGRVGLVSGGWVGGARLRGSTVATAAQASWSRYGDGTGWRSILITPKSAPPCTRTPITWLVVARLRVEIRCRDEVCESEGETTGGNDDECVPAVCALRSGQSALLVHVHVRARQSTSGARTHASRTGGALRERSGARADIQYRV